MGHWYLTGFEVPRGGVQTSSQKSHRSAACAHTGGGRGFCHLSGTSESLSLEEDSYRELLERGCESAG